MKPLVIATLPLIVVAAQPPAGAPDMDVNELASGPYSRMHMLLEKTIFRIDVLTVDIRFDQPVRERFQRIARGQPFADRLVALIADAAMSAEQVFAKLEFKRHVSLDRWVEGVRDSLRRAWQSGLIQEDTYHHVAGNLPRWFQAVVDRGFEEGDQILYRGYPSKLHTVLVSNRGDVLVDQTDQGASPRRALLAGYFAPDTDFREPLVKSLFQQ